MTTRKLKAQTYSQLRNWHNCFFACLTDSLTSSPDSAAFTPVSRWQRGSPASNPHRSRAIAWKNSGLCRRGLFAVIPGCKDKPTKVVKGYHFLVSLALPLSSRRTALYAEKYRLRFGDMPFANPVKLRESFEATA